MNRAESAKAARLRIVWYIGTSMLVGYLGAVLAVAQESAAPRAAAPQTERPIDPDDRGAQIWYFQRLGTTGWQRGQEIYYMRCWICHNDYTVIAEPGAAPSLRDLYKRPTLRNGQAV